MPTDRATFFGASFPAASFDMATSCMALQDMADIPAVFRAGSASLDRVSRRSASGRIWRMRQRFRTT